MASLAGWASLAMFLGRGATFPRTMADAVRHWLNGCQPRGCMVKMAASSRCMGVGCYHFCSDLEMSRLGRCHVGRHHVADPAAQWQQGDHEGEDQVAHVGMITAGRK